MTAEHAAPVEESWFHQLGLSGDPFASGPGPVLGTEPLRKAVDRIRDDLTLGVSHIYVTGSAGIGKTSLARALPGLLRGQPGIAGVGRILEPSRPWLEIRDRITRQMAPPAGVLSPATLRLGAGSGLCWVLVVDSAERLESDLIDHLAGMMDLRNEADRPIFHCILLGNDEFRDRIHSTAFQDRFDPTETLQLELEPLTIRGLRSYLMGRLRKVGWKRECPFTHSATLAVHQSSGGKPAAVNELAGRLMARAVAHKIDEIDAEFVESTLAESLYPVVEPTPATRISSHHDSSLAGLNFSASFGAAGRKASAGSPPHHGRRWVAACLAAAAIATALWAGGTGVGSNTGETRMPDVAARGDGFR